MTKFNVGDKVRVIAEDHPYLKKGHTFIVATVDGMGDVYNEKAICVLKDRVELVESKPTKNQRITALENEVAELKLIVHELREKKSIEPSTTNTVEDNLPKFLNAQEGIELGETIAKGLVDGLNSIIEFEGQQYRKVDRKVRKDDIFIITKDNGKLPSWFTVGKRYKALAPKGCYTSEARVIADDGDDLPIYNEGCGRTLETVDVYELIEEGLNPQIPMVDETIEPLTPNQQRAEIVEKAKKFVEERKKKNCKFEIKERIVTVFLLDSNGMIMKFAHSRCNPSDVFNEHIGKAIALGRALGLDVSEFEQAVQPTVAIGQLLSHKNNKHNHTRWKVDDLNDTGKNLTIIDNKFESLNGETADGGYLPEETWYKIVDDTNAIYEVES